MLRCTLQLLVLHRAISSNSLTPCQKKHSLSKSHVSRKPFQGKEVLVYAAVLSGVIYVIVSSSNRLSATY